MSDAMRKSDAANLVLPGLAKSSDGGSFGGPAAASLLHAEGSAPAGQGVAVPRVGGAHGTSGYGSAFGADTSTWLWRPHSIDLSGLNAAQREAVECTHGPLLVLAGAGSGKTRVLTYRIAHMVADEGVRPWQVLAITFTNKAANEMRERLGALLPGGTRGMWVCTFHAMCVRMLREDAELLGYRPNFTVYDDDDSKRLVKRIMADLGIDTKQLPINGIRSRISSAKNALVGPDEFEGFANTPQLAAASRVYRELEGRLMRANAMDFDDLLVCAHRLLRTRPEVLARYQDRFLQISVDEYQDTNRVQYEITNLLAARGRNLMVVGDDDQSIYSWRGADIQNILDFEKDYPDAKVVKLEENYRSSGHILAAANAVVANNSRRKPKRLFTTRGDGERVCAYQAADERDEGRWIGGQIERLHEAGTSYDDIAVFYRMNAQSRVLEDMFLRAGVPYKIVGGTRFFDRAEIRDVMAYLKLVVNPADDVSAQRVVNTPRRGIGSMSVAKVQSYALAHRMPFLAACQACVAEDSLLTPKVRSALASFTGAIEAARARSGELGEVVESLVEGAGLLAALEAECTVEAEGRIENIREFLRVAQEFDETHDDVAATLESLAQLRAAGALDADAAGTPAGSAGEGGSPATDGLPAGAAGPLATGGSPAGSGSEPSVTVASEKLPAFMEWLALRSDLDALAGSTSAVTLMTVHSAKGLEFPAVFVAGMEEGIFPHVMPGELEAGNLEEERRLAYVAITRARSRLYLSYARTRRSYGSTTANPTSRFVNEIPAEDLRVIGMGSEGFSGTGWEKRGDRHGTFGSGTAVYGGSVFGSSTRSAGGAAKARTGAGHVASGWNLGSSSHAHHAGATFGASGVPEPRRGSGGLGQTDPFAQNPARGIRRDAAKASESFEVGDQVSHKTFGPGIVLSSSGDMIEVRFTRTGKVKKLMKGFAPIVKVVG